MNENVIQMLPAESLPPLPEIYRWGIEVIRQIQLIESPGLTAIMMFISALGTEMLYAPLTLFIFWWIDEKRGLRLGILLIVSAWINIFAKEIFKQPRPFNLEPALGLAYESSYGAPSGHAQVSLCFWVPMAAWLAATFEKRDIRRFAIWAGAIFFILLMGFTRLYLGAHFPTDLLFAWLLGGLILAIWFNAGPRLEGLLVKTGIRSQNICAAVFVLLMNGLYPQNRSFPALLLGFCIGYILMKKRFPFSARGEINGKKPGMVVMLGRCMTGFIGLGIIYIGLKLILPGKGSLLADLSIWGQHSPFYELGHFLRYGLMGLWASAGAPLIFQRMGLASSEIAGSLSGEDSS
jgi:membrane-associated phospholipid phosphatase